MASKAEKWLASRPEGLAAGGVTASVEKNGDIYVQVEAYFHYNVVYLKPKDALALAAWINDTFGEGGGE